MRHTNKDEIVYEPNLKLFRKMTIFLVYTRDILLKYNIVKNGYGFDKLVNDSNWIIRYQIVKQGCKLDILINDPSPEIRTKAEEENMKKDGKNKHR